MLNPGALRQSGRVRRVAGKAGASGSDGLSNEARERRRLAETLAHEREKVRKLKIRLARLEAAEESNTAEIRRLYTGLTLERQPPELSGFLEMEWVDRAARARLRAQARGGDLDAHSGAAPLQGGLFDPPPPSRSLPAVARPPLRVAITSIGPSAFVGCTDPRVVARQLGDPLVEAADVLVFPRAEVRTYHEDARRLPDALRQGVRAGRITLVLDAAGEGHPHSAANAEDHHAFLQAHGADAARTLFLTQDRGYREDYEAWARGQGLAPMRVHVFDSYMSRVFSEFDISGDAVFRHRLARYLRRGSQRSRRFLSLNYTPRPTKLLFLLRLLRDGLWDRGWISFAGFVAEGEEGLTRAAAVKRLLALEGFEEEARTLLPLVDRLEAMEPVMFMAEKFKLHGKQRARAVQAMEIEEYGDSWFSVVTETEMSDRLHRITEKPLKPLLGFHPFLVLGNPGALQLLRGYGFETFSGVFDERYDTEPNPRRRFDMVYAELRRLCALDEPQIARASAELSEIVSFNACWGLTELPRRFRQTLLAGLVDQLVSLRPAA